MVGGAARAAHVDAGCQAACVREATRNCQTRQSRKYLFSGHRWLRPWNGGGPYAASLSLLVQWVRYLVCAFSRVNMCVRFLHSRGPSPCVPCGARPRPPGSCCPAPHALMPPPPMPLRSPTTQHRFGVPLSLACVPPGAPPAMHRPHPAHVPYTFQSAPPHHTEASLYASSAPLSSLDLYGYQYGLPTGIRAVHASVRPTPPHRNRLRYMFYARFSALKLPESGQSAGPVKAELCHLPQCWPPLPSPGPSSSPLHTSPRQPSPCPGVLTYWHSCQQHKPNRGPESQSMLQRKDAGCKPERWPQERS